MTTTTSTPSMFQARPSRPALRAAAILGLCAALFAGFVAHASQQPSAAPAADQVAGSIANHRAA
jgi:hypothetical protein